MSSTVRWCPPGSTLQALFDAAVAADAVVASLRDANTAKGENPSDGAGRVSFQSGTAAYRPFPYTPLQVAREAVLTPPPGLDDAGRMLHALQVEVSPEMRLDVDAHLSDGYSRWTLLYTRSGVLVAHRYDY